MAGKITFLTFADNRYKESLTRVKEQSQNFPFDNRLFLTEDDIPSDFLKTIRYKIHRRGFGYWKWKPFIVLETLRNMNDGDILLYVDAGSSLNENGISRFYEYLKIVQESPSGILAFQHPHLEKDWTKGDLLKYFGCYCDNHILMSLQLASGAFFLRKSLVTMKIAENWLDVYVNHYDLCTDKKSVEKNLIGFIENRHDQSVFSLLLKKIPHDEISWTETQTLNNIYDGRMNMFPILFCRILQNYAKFQKLKHKLSYPYRWMIMFYLKHFEKMYFACKRVF